MSKTLTLEWGIIETWQYLQLDPIYYDLSSFLVLAHLTPSWLVWAETDCTVNVKFSPMSPKLISTLIGMTWKSFNSIPTGLCHLINVYGLIQPMAGSNTVKDSLV